MLDIVGTANLWLATGFGLGLMPVAPGTFGSLLGLPLAWWLSGRSTRQQVVIITLMLLAAVPVCHMASLHFDGQDHGSIVADEYVAFPLAVLGLKAARHPLVLALAFGVYRFFDGLKPPPIHLAEHVTGGVGIVLDDVIAALVSWLVVALLVTLWQRRQQKLA
ncbi:MAG: phosphatidylglycerophosphatase A [Halomonas sp.]|nr:MULTISPECIES: phosphatidylglycerophosphatase A [unclassified Halomonas]ATH76294.1 phosphatidylglycerophosphatase A [Halomonas hydrothermalis]NGO89292.1 phosphatidylglycerophosphatase A [Halomonas sp.]